MYTTELKPAYNDPNYLIQPHSTLPTAVADKEEDVNYMLGYRAAVKKKRRPSSSLESDVVYEEKEDIDYLTYQRSNPRNADRTKSYRANQKKKTNVTETDNEKKENGSRWEEQRSHANVMRGSRVLRQRQLGSSVVSVWLGSWLTAPPVPGLRLRATRRSFLLLLYICMFTYIPVQLCDHRELTAAPKELL
ncbi:hypothetical protein L916_20879 [Phytophthora nicotianae]|uniref:Uncharacterized protein n=1 Tax=Phytophthora nicotianae TaxID=4792 RepID=W2HTH8_PHYNI|nr:hypothetical protein L916_20879 [Phytophthora nicotianae]